MSDLVDPFGCPLRFTKAKAVHWKDVATGTDWSLPTSSPLDDIARLSEALINQSPPERVPLPAGFREVRSMPAVSPPPTIQRDTFSGGFNNTIRARNERAILEWRLQNLRRAVIDVENCVLHCPRPGIQLLVELLIEAGARIQKGKT